MNERDCLDLLIIGGGVNGAGLARDAAGRGLKTALIEQRDLASATSSASTKLIHGGLRYLEFFEFRLVRESLVERERLLTIAPHIVRPLQFVLPHVQTRRPRWMIRTGLFLYDHLGARERLPASRSIRRSDGLFAPLKGGVEYGFTYADCWVDDSRLVVLNAMDAAGRGAAIHTRTRFVGASIEEDVWRARCERGGETFELKARALVNAAGPWVEQVLRSLPGAVSASRVRLVKGSHIAIPRLYAEAHAYLLQNPDGRITFTIPFEDKYTLVGTTDAPFTGDPSKVEISPEEIDYLCRSVNAYFQQQIDPAQVCWTYAGVRPLLDDEATNASRITRDYRLELNDAASHPPVLSIFGGKITTYRRLAETALARLRPHLKMRAAGWTHREPLPGGDIPEADFGAFLRDVQHRWHWLNESIALRLARAYGTRIAQVIGSAQRFEDLGEHFGAGLTRAEVDYLRAHEWAETSEDVLWRRSKLGLHMSEDERARLAAYFG